MKTTLFAIATLCVGTAALALPVPSRTIVNPTERMVTVPGLEFVGASRISTVEFCAAQTNTNWRNLLTDSDLESMEKCLIEMT